MDGLGGVVSDFVGQMGGFGGARFAALGGGHWDGSCGSGWRVGFGALVNMVRMGEGLGQGGSVTGARCVSEPGVFGGDLGDCGGDEAGFWPQKARESQKSGRFGTDGNVCATGIGAAGAPTRGAPTEGEGRADGGPPLGDLGVLWGLRLTLGGRVQSDVIQYRVLVSGAEVPRAPSFVNSGVVCGRLQFAGGFAFASGTFGLSGGLGVPVTVP